MHICTQSFFLCCSGQLMFFLFSMYQLSDCDIPSALLPAARFQKRVLPVMALIIFSFLALYGCGSSGEVAEEDTPAESAPTRLMPEISTMSIRNIEAVSARSGGVFTVQQGRQIISKGVCYHTSPNPTVRGSGECTDEGDRFGDFDSVLANLRPETTYYVRAYATNADGTVYGQTREFTTRRLNVLTVETNTPQNLDKENRTALLGGRLQGSAAEQVRRKGFLWATYPNPEVNDSGEDVNIVRIEERVTQLSASISGLRYGVQYYVRAFAEHDGRVEYGESRPFVLEPYAIGDRGPAGGLIFFYDEDDRYPDFEFMEAAPALWTGIRGERRLIWGCEGRLLGSDALDIGGGSANTRRIVQRCSEAESIIEVVNSYSENGYSDWFIPSRAELDLMWINLHEQGLGDFQPEFYWSSTEQDGDSGWGMYFGTGNQRSLPKWLKERVRPVRTF